MERQNRPLTDLPKIVIGFGLLAIHPYFESKNRAGDGESQRKPNGGINRIVNALFTRLKGEKMDEKVKELFDRVRDRIDHGWYSIAANDEEWKELLTHISSLEARVKALQKRLSKYEQIVEE